MITTQNIALASIVFSKYRMEGDRAEYAGPASSDLNTDELIVRSISPKRGNGFYGNRKSTFNMVRSTAVLGLDGSTIDRARSLSVAASIPVGTTTADVLEDAYQLSILLQDADFVTALIVNGQIDL